MENLKRQEGVIAVFCICYFEIPQIMRIHVIYLI